MRRILIVLAVSLCALHATVAQDMRSLFLNAPESVFPLLTANNRADCVDYYEAGMKAYAVNRLGGVSYLRLLTADYLYIDVSGSSWSEASLLPFGADSIICMVKGVTAEAADSRLFFYSKDWNPLPTAEFLVEPEISDFFISQDSAALYAGMCDIYLVKYALSADTGILTAEYAMPSYMGENEAVLLCPLLRRISYRWDGKRFVME